MSLVIQELERGLQKGPIDVDGFLESHEFPIVEGSKATFVWHGRADAVHLRHWIYGLTSSQPFHRFHGTDLWILVMDIPPGSRVEYKLEVVNGDRHQLVQDTRNPHLATDPYGANSVVHGEGYTFPDWVEHDPDARPGELQEKRWRSEILGDVRPLGVYLPARFRTTRRYPLLVFHDGQDYQRFSSLKTVLDNLIHRLEIPPLIAALTQSPRRMVEYADDPRHADFLVKELVPFLSKEYPLVDRPDARGLVGASFGAVASLSTAWRHPGYFGKLLLQSGSFVFTDIGEHDRGPVFDKVVDFTNAFRANPGKPAESVYMSCGQYESLIYYNRSLLPLLQSTGMSVRFTEARDGHNWENWRDRLREGLSWLFPGPLWMVYE